MGGLLKVGACRSASDRTLRVQLHLVLMNLINAHYLSYLSSVCYLWALSTAVTMTFCKNTPDGSE